MVLSNPYKIELAGDGDGDVGSNGEGVFGKIEWIRR